MCSQRAGANGNVVRSRLHGGRIPPAQHVSLRVLTSTAVFGKQVHQCVGDNLIPLDHGDSTGADSALGTVHHSLSSPWTPAAERERDLIWYHFANRKDNESLAVLSAASRKKVGIYIVTIINNYFIYTGLIKCFTYTTNKATKGKGEHMTPSAEVSIIIIYFLL